MFSKNVGNVERILRIVVGAALIAAYFINGGGTYSWLYLLGIVPLATGIIGWCPPYAILGISTCKT
ncbi:MAG: YgaP family membrane protein, partial [Marinibacterium sp.]